MSFNSYVAVFTSGVRPGVSRESVPLSASTPAECRVLCVARMLGRQDALCAKHPNSIVGSVKEHYHVMLASNVNIAGDDWRNLGGQLRGRALDDLGFISAASGDAKPRGLLLKGQINHVNARDYAVRMIGEGECLYWDADCLGSFEAAADEDAADEDAADEAAATDLPNLLAELRAKHAAMPPVAFHAYMASFMPRLDKAVAGKPEVGQKRARLEDDVGEDSGAEEAAEDCDDDDESLYRPSDAEDDDDDDIVSAKPSDAAARKLAKSVWVDGDLEKRLAPHHKNKFAERFAKLSEAFKRAASDELKLKLAEAATILTAERENRQQSIALLATLAVSAKDRAVARAAAKQLARRYIHWSAFYVDDAKEQDAEKQDAQRILVSAGIQDLTVEAIRRENPDADSKDPDGRSAYEWSYNDCGDVRPRGL